MLDIQNLTVKTNDKIILNNLSLCIPQGEIHALMGPNGSGKSTLANVLAGKGEYEIISGKIYFNNIDILPLAPEERFHLGIFLAFQYPIEIPGLNIATFIKTALNAKRVKQDLPEMDSFEFLEKFKVALSILKMPETFLNRCVNEGFSGGEKKCNEILQMLLLEPQFVILDESDSGLDIDMLQIVANALNQYLKPQRSILIITHYQRILNYTEPLRVHIMMNGQIIKSGDKQLVGELEAQGYGNL